MVRGAIHNLVFQSFWPWWGCNLPHYSNILFSDSYLYDHFSVIAFAIVLDYRLLTGLIPTILHTRRPRVSPQLLPHHGSSRGLASGMARDRSSCKCRSHIICVNPVTYHLSNPIN